MQSKFLWSLGRWFAEQGAVPERLQEVVADYRRARRSFPKHAAEAVFWHSPDDDFGKSSRAIALFQFAFASGSNGSIDIPQETVRLYHAFNFDEHKQGGRSLAELANSIRRMLATQPYAVSTDATGDETRMLEALYRVTSDPVTIKSHEMASLTYVRFGKAGHEELATIQTNESGEAPYRLMNRVNDQIVAVSRHLEARTKMAKRS